MKRHTSGNIIELPSSKKLQAEAAQWLTVLGRDNLSDADVLAFKKWYSTSPRHQEAYSQLAGLWDNMAILKELDSITVPDAVLPKPIWSRVFRTSWIYAAACVFVILVSTSLMLPQRSAPANHVYVSDIGRQETVKLEDGSFVQLNTDSKVSVHFLPDYRLVRLLRGEAYFKVAHDPSRPFVVQTARRQVQAIGTAFTVRLHEGSVIEVVVEEGRVALASGPLSVRDNSKDDEQNTDVDVPFETEEPSQVYAELSAGQSAIFDDHVENLADVAQAEMARKLAWRQGMLAYAGEPLSKVVDDISRYTDIHIEIADAQLGTIPIGGHFRTGEIEGLLDSLELTFGIKVHYITENHIRLTEADR